jgi:hypothetical protein
MPKYTTLRTPQEILGDTSKQKTELLEKILGIVAAGLEMKYAGADAPVGICTTSAPYKEISSLTVLLARELRAKGWQLEKIKNYPDQLGRDTVLISITHLPTPKNVRQHAWWE